MRYTDASGQCGSCNKLQMGKEKLRETSESCLMLETVIDAQQAHSSSLEKKKKENPSCSDG